MSYSVTVTARGERARNGCFDYISERSPEGAQRWLESYEQAVASLQMQQFFGSAPESEHHKEEIRQRIFKTKQGLPYRLLFIVRDETIYIIHVRGPGQDLMRAGEIDLPSRS